MDKQFDLIPIENGHVVVNQSKDVKVGDWFYNPVNKTVHKVYEVSAGQKSGVWKIVIAHTGIETLKDSGLPLIEIPNEIDLLAEKFANDYLPYSKELFWMRKNDVIAGYKAAGYTEEDMVDFHLATSSTKHPLYISYKKWYRENYDKWTPESLIQWYKSHKNKHPKAVVLEMEDEMSAYHRNGLGAINPKVIDNHVIVKQLIYE